MPNNKVMLIFLGALIVRLSDVVSQSFD